jgi:uncharacterized protein
MSRNLIALLVALGAFAASAPVGAASFDCAKASRPHERLICSTPALSAADDELSAAYRAAVERSPEAARAPLRQGQREWIPYLPALCSDDGKGRVFKDRKEAAGCLLNGYRERIALLGRIPETVGPFAVVPAQRFRILDADRSAAGFRPVAVHTLDRPFVTGPDAAAADFLNAEAAGITAGVPTDDRTSDSGVTVALSMPRPGLATLTISSEFYGHGAAHPISAASFRHLRLDERRPLVFADVFASPAAVAVLKTLVLSELRRQAGDDLFDDIDEAVEKRVADPEAWTFEPEGLSILFNVYEIAPYAAGPQSATVPWIAIEPDLTPYARGLLAKP